MSEIEIPPLPNGFEIDENKTAGNAHSGHNVVFGNYEGEDVALKPFIGKSGKTIESRRNKAEHEKRMYEVVGKLGYRTLRPIKILEDNGIAYLLTEYTPNLMAGTSFDMSRQIEDDRQGKSPASVSTDIMTTLGNLHTDEITHGDAKLRNYAFHRITGDGPYVVDLEGAQKHKSRHARGSEFYLGAVGKDISSIAYNLGQNGFGAFTNDAEQEDIFSDVIIYPYLLGRGGPLRIDREVIDMAMQSYTNGIEKYLDHDHKY